MKALAWRQQWQALTREGRDTLWLLGMLTLVMAPHVPRLPWWASAGAALALSWRARLAWRDGVLPSRWLLIVLLIASIAATFLTHGTLVGRAPGVTLIVILTTLKCLELKARRDGLVCLYLGFFLILTQFLYSQGIATAVLMLAGVWGLLTALIMGQRPLGRPTLVDSGRDAMRAMVWGLPLMVVLFVLFPRFGPLWSLPNDASARTGLSDSLSLGQFAELAQDDSIALRIRFLGVVPRPSQMYFRGPTLDGFDGRTWRPDLYRFEEDIEPLPGQPINYEMTLEPSPLPVMPLLEGTLSAAMAPAHPNVLLRRRGLDWFYRGGLNQRLQVQAQAWPRWRQQQPLAHPQALRRWLQLPAGFNPRTLAWAQAFQQQPRLADASPQALAQAVLVHIRQQNFRYTLSPGLPADPDSPHLIDDFWLDRQQGFCEHFATAYTVVMRAMGVPSRVVTGFQGAELNVLDGQYIVRNSNAHAWVEIWEPDAGWIRVDPTAAVAPERVERPPPRPLPFAGMPGPLGTMDPASLKRLRAMWEAVDHRWNVWVLQYSGGRQMELLRSLGWDRPDWQDLGRLLGWALAALGLGSSLFAWWTRERSAKAPWQAPMMRVHKALSRLQMGQPAGQAPAAASAWHAHLALRWGPDAGGRAQAILRALRQLDALRYGPERSGTFSAATNASTKALARQIEKLARLAEPSGAHSLPTENNMPT